METSKVEIAKKLRAAREPTGLNQGEMAETLGVSRNTYAVWESETIKRNPPNQLKLLNLARFYGLEPHVFNDGKIPAEQVGAMVAGVLADKNKTQIPVKQVLASRQAQGDQVAEILDETGTALGEAMLTMVQHFSPQSKPQNDELESNKEDFDRGEVMRQEYKRAQQRYQIAALRRKALHPAHQMQQHSANSYVQTVATALFAAARFHLMQMNVTEAALDKCFDTSIVFDRPGAGGQGRNRASVNFYFSGSADYPTPVLADFNVGLVRVIGDLVYGNHDELDSRIGHLLKLERLTGKRGGCKKLMLIFDTEHIVATHPLFERTRAIGGGSGEVLDRVNALKPVAEMCGVDLRAVKTPEDVAKILYGACTS